MKLDDVALSYPLFDQSALTMKQALLSSTRLQGGRGVTHVQALKHIDLALQPGDRLALLGSNGSGKSSLLKVMAGLYQPTTGHVMTQGKIAALLGLGFGTEPDATGYENIMLAGMAMGYRLREMRACADDIVAFSELGDFIHLPLRTYSSGMRARLSFAVATCQRPDLILIDEGIGVGDARFIDRAHQRLESMTGDQAILVMASHLDDLLRCFCRLGLWLHQGEIRYFGALEEALARYRAFIGA